MTAKELINVDVRVGDILEMKKPETTLEDAFMKIIKEGDDK